MNGYKSLYKTLRAPLALLGGLLAVAGPASAQTYHLNFDTTLANAPIVGGGLVSASYNIAGVTFTGNDYIETGGGIGASTSFPNFATGLGNLAPFEIDFATPQNYVSAFNITNSEYTLTAYDAANNLLSSLVTSTDLQQTVVTAPGAISKVIFTATNTAGYGLGYGLDDLEFSSTQLAPGQAAVPEAGSGLLLAVGLAVSAGVVGLRRKRRPR